MDLATNLLVELIPFYIISQTNLLVMNHFHVSLQNKAIFVYKRKGKGRGAESVSDESREQLKKAYTAEGLSDTAKKDIRRLVDNWQTAVLSSQKLWSKGKERRRRYFVLITLTLPAKQNEDDNTLKRKYLNVWLQNLERDHEGINWLWVAECQHNGNLHFHVVVDRWVDFKWIKRTWNRIMDNGDYVARYAAKFGHKNPPSVNVEGQRKMTSPAAYITKYLTGDKFIRKIQGRKWGCCDNLRQIDRWGFVCDENIHALLQNDCGMHLKHWQSHDYSTAYYFEKPIMRSGVFDKILYVWQNSICGSLSAFYSELGDCILEDLPIDLR